MIVIRGLVCGADAICLTDDGSERKFRTAPNSRRGLRRRKSRRHYFIYFLPHGGDVFAALILYKIICIAQTAEIIRHGAPVFTPKQNNNSPVHRLWIRVALYPARRVCRRLQMNRRGRPAQIGLLARRRRRIVGQDRPAYYSLLTQRIPPPPLPEAVVRNTRLGRTRPRGLKNSLHPHAYNIIAKSFAARIILKNSTHNVASPYMDVVD